MSRKDLPLLLILVALWIAWPHIYRRFFYEPPPPAPTGVEETIPSPATAPDEPPPRATQEPAVVAAPDALRPAEAPPTPTTPARIDVIEDEEVRLVLSSRGATVKEAVLKDYRADVDPESGPVVLDFTGAPALAYLGLPGLSSDYDFEMEVDHRAGAVTFVRTTEDGIRLRRTIRFDEGYLLRVTDELSALDDQPKRLPVHRLRLGGMENLPAERRIRGMEFLGVDTLLQGGEGVKHWGGKLSDWLGEEEDGELVRDLGQAADWIAAKNKFFVQILTPERSAEECLVYAWGDPYEERVERVSAAVVYPELLLGPGEPHVREFRYYVGPKKYAELRKQGLHQVDIMEFFLAPIAKFLLYVLNFIHDYVWPHNYGLAIMLLTIIIRIMFWPLTHKGTESMKRMQELQPLMKDIREKHKDNPKKQQQEMMQLYKQHKVNPMMGCLPMLIQIPVFIALFYVLRSAIELRFAEFLWINDLSEPERLFADVLPLPLNILPLIMAGTTLWQQKLTPTGGDPNQQKIMMFMPLVMLIFLYNFASGLVLYWTTNNCIMIVQQIMQRRRAAAKSGEKEKPPRTAARTSKGRASRR